MKFFVLERLKKESTLKGNQFGGRKGSGCEHYIISLLNSIYEAIDQPDSVSNVLAVDFQKAFNTMNHEACLSALKKKGVSEHVTRMIFAFLNGRKLRARIGSTLSDSLDIKGGSLQGTLLGNLLFTLTTDSIEEGRGVDEVHENNRAELPTDFSYENVGNCVSTPSGVERTLSMISGVSEVTPSTYLRNCERTFRYEMSGSESENEDEPS